MRNLWILLKNSFNMMIGSVTQRRGKSRSSLLTFAIMIVLLVAVFSYNAYSTISSFSFLGNQFAIFNGIFTILVTLFVLGCLRATSNNTPTSDSDFLLSLPIKKYIIILSKTLNKYLYDLFFTCIVFVPYVVIYSIFYGINIGFILMSVTLILLLPLLSVGLTYILDFSISRLFNKTRFAGVFKSLFSLFLFGIVFVFIMIVSVNYGFLDETMIKSYFETKPISNTLLNYLFSPNIQNVLITLVLTLGVFLLGTLLFTLNYGKIFVAYKSKNKDLKFKQNKTPLNLLLKKEFNNYFSSPTYLVNTSMGPVMIIIFCILSINLNLSAMLSPLGDVTTYIFAISTIVISFMSCTSTISAVSISLEGKSIWFLKSMPIKIKTIFLSKLLFHNIIVLTPIVIAGIFLSIYFKFNIIFSVLLILIPTVLTLTMSVLGLYINLRHPMLDFDDEAKVIKQSMSVLLTLLIGLVITLLPVMLFLIFELPILPLSLGFLALLIVLFVIFSLILFTKGVKLFRIL